MQRFIPLLFLAGCMVGPDYCPPEVCLPHEYQEAPPVTETIDLSTWWKQFDDPLLDELISDALACNYDFRIALHKIEEVRGLYLIDQSTLFPKIQGNLVGEKSRRSANLTSDIVEATGTAADITASDLGGPLIQWFYQTGLDASWEIDLWGKNRRRAEAAFRDMEASRENALDIQVTLISDVANIYIEVRSLQQRIEAKKEQIERQKELLEMAKSRYEAGLTSYRDVSLSKSLLDEQESTLPPLKEAFKLSLHALAILLGRPPENFAVGKGFIPNASGKIPKNLPSDLICHRPDIRQADRELAAATSRIGLAKAELLPSFSLIGSFGVQSNLLDKLFIWPSRYWTIAPQMIWNLFSGGKLLAQIQVTTERQKQAILNYERAINNALKDVEDRLVGYFEEEKRLVFLEEQLAATSLTRDLSLEQYLAGLISLDDVLDAERTLFLTQETMLQSQGIQMIQLVGLYKALGGGWECLR